jgi:hypothetical protein
MKPSILVILFMCVWFGFVGLFCFGIFLMALLQFNKIALSTFQPSTLIPYAMFIFGWCLCYFGFKAESKKSKDFLATLLSAHEPQ